MIICQGSQCQGTIHSLKFTAKYYAVVQAWVNREKVWRMYTLEITENLERQLRGQELRGQVWNLTREETSAGKRSPLCGNLVETIEEAYLPTPYNLDAWLCNFFRLSSIPKDQRSPIPDRPVVYDEPGSPPSRCLDTKTAVAIDALEEERRKQAQEEMRKRWSLNRVANGNGHEA